MNQQLKDEFMRDIGEYLQRGTKLRYPEYGIPYCRGYLFPGPPGTGKTSLCHAAAGVHGLPIYNLSLNSLTEDELTRLISNLPRRCILLLEDIDTNSITNARTNDKLYTTSVEAARANNQDNDGIHTLTLGSLLNAFDGVAAGEGRVLVLTANHPENLDAALVRAGRIDRKIQFSYPDHDTTKRLFLLIYPLPDEYCRELSLSRCQYCTQVPPPAHSLNRVPSEDSLEILAGKFATSFTGKTISQADIQGYLLCYPNDPEFAVKMVSAWIQGEETQFKE